MRPTRLLLSAIVAALAFPAFADGALPLANLNADDTALLSRGEALIRSVANPRGLALAATGQFADELRSRIAKLNPNYLSEVILTIPYRKGAVEELAAALADVQGYVGIKYYSRRQKATYDLFDKMEVTSRRTEAEGAAIETWQHMLPFADYGARYSYRLKSLGQGSELYFESTNTSGIKYNGIQAVAPGNMAWLLYAFPSGERLIFYGVGGVRAFDMLGVMRDRLEGSFIGRIEAFFGHMSKKLKG